MVRKTRQVIWRWKYTTNHCEGENIYIYWKKREKANFVMPIEKIKRHAIGWPEEKPPLELLIYNEKSAQY